jgi:hypothetical protein
MPAGGVRLLLSRFNGGIGYMRAVMFGVVSTVAGTMAYVLVAIALASVS